MKRLITIVMVLAGGMILTSSALADDVDDVKAAIRKHFTALNKGDAGAVTQDHMPSYRIFLNDGGLLIEDQSREEQRTNLQAMFDAGLKINWQIRHLDVKLHKDTAIATFYVAGTITSPGGDTQQGTWRVTEVWVKERGQWKEAHHHSSPLVPGPRSMRRMRSGHPGKFGVKTP